MTTDDYITVAIPTRLWYGVVQRIMRHPAESWVSVVYPNLFPLCSNDLPLANDNMRVVNNERWHR